MAEKTKSEDQPPEKAETPEKVAPPPPANDEGISLQDANDIVALLDRLFQTGNVKGEEALRVGIIRTKLVSLISKFSETK